MSKAPDTFSRSFSMAELLVHALVIELEAVQSYKDLAVQMEQCGNDEVAGLFEKMSELEAGHATKIREKAGDIELPELAPWEYRWAGMESPESIDLAGIHYLMTPHHALKLALENEMNAMASSRPQQMGARTNVYARWQSSSPRTNASMSPGWRTGWQNTLNRMPAGTMTLIRRRQSISPETAARGNSHDRRPPEILA